MNLIAVQLKAQGQQNAAHLGLGNFRTQQPVDFVRLQLYNRGSSILCDHIQYTIYHLTGTQQFHQFTGPLHGLQRIHGV